ncbi:mechanosensitive ion channel family protein [Desulfitibacter alkalitolerans]|uniref:mechanosensitive ion channel family protein n=1 Tax=Desulfitibacter alkalitolerans TaxID=264641 RepID=UPI00047F3BF3|nr:mechanosensitive ion channel family protein [Desulfitibacter alkalitolerans]
MDFVVDFYSLHETFLINVAIAVAIFMLFLILRRIFVNYILKLVIRFTDKTNTCLDTAIIRSFEKSLRVFFIILGIYLSSLYLPLQEKHDLMFLGIWRISIIILIAWGLYNFVGNFSNIFAEVENKLDISVDKILVPFFSKVIKVVIVILTFVLIISELGYDINGFIAGLGLGGLAIALAAQNTASNIFGGIVIITDKPFSIGDWIESPSVEGTVEDINFRSTRVRTFADAVVTVPNATLANQPVTNWTRMGRRRITFNLGVTYTTPRKKIQACVYKIKYMLENHKDIHQQTIFVRFDSFNDSSLDIFLYFFTKTTNWGEFLKVKEDVNYKIMEILEEEGVSVAFPSRSLYLETPIDISK